MSTAPESSRDLIILERIEQDPDATQASLAAQLGVAEGEYISDSACVNDVVSVTAV